MPIVWLASLLGVPIKERVAGSTIFQCLMAPATQAASTESTAAPIRVFFFGGPAGVAKAAHNKINSTAKTGGHQGGGIISVGYESPGFGTVEDMSTPATIQAINASQADFLLVALGASKGQAWIERNRAALNSPVISHLGAVVNFVAGKIDRAPAWVQRVGFEWLWRIKEEPALWRRYMADGTELIRLLCTRVLPLTWLYRTNHPGRHFSTPSGIDIVVQGQWRVVNLQGPWVRANLNPLRDALDLAASEGGRVKINLQQVTFVDAAFLGLLMLFADYKNANNAAVNLAVVRPDCELVKKIFKYSGAEYLLENNG
jgi:N-acetylglucosaminyldiphosphoundecaprenol N-acetyl-beta-D-mannosaminyltransferase